MARYITHKVLGNDSYNNTPAHYLNCLDMDNDNPEERRSVFSFISVCLTSTTDLYIVGKQVNHVC